jgi:hypothetical protein
MNMREKKRKERLVQNRENTIVIKIQVFKQY